MDVIFRQGDEEAAGVLDAVAGDPLEDAVLLNALAGGL
jgi:2-keto-4-pentenoate hydratase